MKNHDAHYGAYVEDRMRKLLNGRTIYEIKRESVAIEKRQSDKFYETQPQEGDYVYFRSISSTGKVFTGYGTVKRVRLKEPRVYFALYEIESDSNGVFEAYMNHPEEDKQGEFIRHTKGND